MKFTTVLLLYIFCLTNGNWFNNFDEARQVARQKHQHILLNFSGSDWCGPCIRLHKEIFETNVFKAFAETNLVLVNADFPRLKKNQLPANQQKLNDAIAEQYNSKGSFPLTILLNEDGKIIKEWDGYPKMKPQEFVEDIQFAIDQVK